MVCGSAGAYVCCGLCTDLHGLDHGRTGGYDPMGDRAGIPDLQLLAGNHFWHSGDTEERGCGAEGQGPFEGHEHYGSCESTEYRDADLWRHDHPDLCYRGDRCGTELYYPDLLYKAKI